MIDLQLNQEQQRQLLQLAREAIRSRLTHEEAPDNQATKEPWLQQPRACFVTLKKRGELRGCIGCMEPIHPLAAAVIRYARAAAFEDDRFAPLSLDELAQIHIEISLLSAMTPLACNSEAELYSLLKPEEDGLLLSFGNHRATFLPQVWQQLPTPELFLARLKQKAGLTTDFWHDKLQFQRYSVEHFAEEA